MTGPLRRLRSARVVWLGSCAGLVALAAGGCATVLGFEDTTLMGDAAPSQPDDDGSVSGEVDAGEGPDSEAGKLLSLEPSHISVRRGGPPVVVTVSIDRGNTVEGELTVRLTDLAKGISSQPVTMSGAVSTATLSVVATGSAASGSSTAHVIIDGFTASAPLEISVVDTSGGRDPGFGKDGVVVDESKGPQSAFYALATTSDAIYAGGKVAAGGWLVRRYSLSGVLDTDVHPDLPDNGDLRALAIDSVGRTLCVGTSPPGIASANQLTVVRLTKAGAVDATFGANGIYRLPTGDAPLGSTGLGAAAGPGDTVWIAGQRTDPAGHTSGLVLALGADGKVAGGFNQGKVLAVGDKSFVGLGVEPDGRLTVGGTTTTGSGSMFFLTRRTASGDLDNTFGKDGAVNFGTGFSARAFARASDGALVLGGVSDGDSRFAAARTSGAGAVAWARSVATGTATGYLGAAVQVDGRIVLAGSSTTTEQGRVDRLQADGSFDATFGTAGTSHVEPTAKVSLHAVAITPTGRIVVAGNRVDDGPALYMLTP